MTQPGTDWARLHPLTPLARAGRFVLLLGALFGQQGLRSDSPRVLLVGLLVGTPLAALAGYVSWRTTRWRVADGELQVDSGVLHKRNRRVPLARVQSVDVVKPLLARLLGLAEVRLEVAGGGGGAAEGKLAYLRDDEAAAVRLRLLALTSGRVEGDAVAVPESTLVVVPSGALVGSILLGAPLVLLGVGLVAAVVALVLEPAVGGALLFTLGPLVLAVGAAAVRRFLSESGFTVSESVDGLRLRHGLLDKRSQTIPAGRVQSVRTLEPLLWRRQGWVRVEVDVAGYAAERGEEQSATSALLPVAPRDLATQVVQRVLEAPVPAAVAPPGRLARWRAPLSYRRLRVGLDQRFVVTTSGVVSTTTDAVPLARVQSLRLTVGPLQRRLGLATVHADTAGRRLPGARMPHRDTADAHALLDALVTATRAARATRR